MIDNAKEWLTGLALKFGKWFLIAVVIIWFLRDPGATIQWVQNAGSWIVDKANQAADLLDQITGR